MIIIMIPLCYWNMWKFSRKNTLENFPEKYEIFQTIFPPHNTILEAIKNY